MTFEWSLNYNTVRQLDLYCKQHRKWREILYFQDFFAFEDMQDLCKTCNVDMALLEAAKRDSLLRKAQVFCEEEPQKELSLPKPPSPHSIPPSVLPPRPVGLYPPLSTCDPLPSLLPYPGDSQPNLCPLVEAGREFGFQVTHKPFSLIELEQIKQDLRKFSDNPHDYIETFKHLTLAYDVSRKDIMTILGQTLSVTKKEKKKVLKEARAYANCLTFLIPNIQ